MSWIKKIDQFLESNLKSRILGFFIMVIFLLITFSSFHKSGHIVFGDLDFGFVLKGYIDRIFPLWNDVWSTSTFFNGTRLPIMFFLYNIANIITDNPSILEKLVIFVLLLISGFSMFMLVNQILKFEVRDKKLNINYIIIFFISLFSGFYYAYNPWSIMRIQHLFLLVGYAILPLIFYEIMYFSENEMIHKYANKPKKKIFYHIVLAAILYMIAIGAVHYLFFTFFFIGSWWLYRIRAFIILRKNIKGSILVTIRYCVFGAIFLGLIMYWFIPYMGAGRIASINPPSINTIDSVTNLARYSTYKHVLYLVSYWWTMIDLKTIPVSFWYGGAIILITIFGGNLLNLKNKYTLYFMIMGIGFIVLSTGTRVNIAGFYKWLVFDNPAAGQAGFIFRDSNKLVGLVAFCFAVLWATGIASILSAIKNYKERVDKEKKYLLLYKNVIYGDKKVLIINWYNYLFVIFLIVTFFSYYYYLKPFHKTFINHFYGVVDIPKDYYNFMDYQKQDTNSGKYLYLPRYESVISPGYDFGVADWNLVEDPQRPTSSFDIYSTIKKTYNPLEGATTYLGNFYEYITDYLSNGRGKNIAKYLYLIGVDKLVFHNDMHGMHDEYTKILNNLAKQDNLKKVKEIGFFTIFKNKDNISYGNVFLNNIYHFGGMKNLETLFNIPFFDYKKYSSIFVEQDFKVNTTKGLEKPGDIVSVIDKNDYIMNLFSEDDMVYPFDFNNYSDGFSRFAKMREDVPDWKWHLKNIGINNIWDFGLNKGFVYTYAGAMVDVEPYEYIHDKGKDIIDFKSIVNISDLFLANDESSIKLGLEKTSKYDEIPAIKGEVMTGEGKLWKAGIMKNLKVKENMGYVFEVVVSGKGVNSIHGKVKFLDKDGKEIGVSYVSAPRFASDFDVLKFSGQFVTPVGTKEMAFSFNTLQNPSKKVYWFIHDIKLKELEKETKENVVNMDYDFKKTGEYYVLSRSFDNIKGGEYNIKILNKNFVINTKTKNINSFNWRRLGTIKINELGKQDIKLTNKIGFNAINAIAFIPKRKYDAKIKQLQEGKNITSQMMIFEAEDDFELNGGIQSNDSNIDLSSGRAVNFDNGILKRKISILKDGIYNIYLNLNKFSKENEYTISLISKVNNSVIYSKKISVTDNNLFILKGLNIPYGDYLLQINVSDLSKNLVSTNDLRLYDKKLDLFDKEELLKLSDEKGCSFNQGLEKTNYNFKKLNNKFIFNLKRGFSCFFVTITHGMLEVKPGERYYISYLLQKYNTRDLHAKIKLFDKDKKYLDYIYLEDYEDKLQYKDGDNKHTQYILKIPENVSYIQLNFLSKQIQDFKDSNIVISDLLIKNYSNLAGVDSVLLYDNNINFDQNNIVVKTKVIDDKKMSNTFKFKISDYFGKILKLKGIQEYDKGGVLQILESYTPLWQANFGSGYVRPIISNIFLNGYSINTNISNENDANIDYVPKKFLIFGYGISFLTLIFISTYLVYLRFIKPKFNLSLKIINYLKLLWKKIKSQK